uniref:Neur_chan_memb domain-containing protein n=1 Tax=Ascaris lumbricoides TaxID=6252 RepID=A0A0M3I2U6_ASCLU
MAVAEETKQTAIVSKQLTMAVAEETKQTAIVSKRMKERRFYKANDRPPIALSLLFGLQQVMVCVSALLTIPFILSNELCPGRDVYDLRQVMVCVSALLTIPFILSSELCPGRDVYDLRVKLISSTFVVSGISTIIQTMLGMR